MFPEVGLPLGVKRRIAPVIQEQVELDLIVAGAVHQKLVVGRAVGANQLDSAAETERQLLTEDPVPPSRLNPRVPRDLETIGLMCLRKDPLRRYATATALAADVARFQRASRSPRDGPAQLNA